MALTKNFTPIYTHEWDINFTQCAPNGYLKYENLCNLLQLTAAQHSISGNLSFNDMQEFNQAWVLSKLRIEVDALPKSEDKVIVKTWIENMEGSRSIRNIEMHLDGKKIVGATTYWAVLNTKLRKVEPLALPHDHFINYPENKATKEGFTKINFLRDTKKVAERTIVLSDLDVVNHVNNVKYLEWCLDTLDPKSILNQEIKSFEMLYLRELNWNDKVEIGTATKEKETYFSVVKEGKVCCALILNWK